jgi:hypothetical protein
MVLQKKSLRTVLQTDKREHYSTDEGDAEQWGEEKFNSQLYTISFSQAPWDTELASPSCK